MTRVSAMALTSMAGIGPRPSFSAIRNPTFGEIATRIDQSLAPVCSREAEGS